MVNVGIYRYAMHGWYGYKFPFKGVSFPSLQPNIRTKSLEVSQFQVAVVTEGGCVPCIQIPLTRKKRAAGCGGCQFCPLTFDLFQVIFTDSSPFATPTICWGNTVVLWVFFFQAPEQSSQIQGVIGVCFCFPEIALARESSTPALPQLPMAPKEMSCRFVLACRFAGSLQKKS